MRGHSGVTDATVLDDNALTTTTTCSASYSKTQNNTNKYECMNRNWRTPLHMRPADAGSTLTKWHHFSAWNEVMAAIFKLWHHIRNQLCHTMLIYLKNNLAKFCPDTIWNDGALGFHEEGAPTRTTRKSRRVAITTIYHNITFALAIEKA